MCLATDACQTAYPGVTSSIPARSHTFMEIDREIISTVILLPSAESFKKGLHFPIGILGQVWYLIVSIPDLCTLTYFVVSYKG